MTELLTRRYDTMELQWIYDTYFSYILPIITFFLPFTPDNIQRTYARKQIIHNLHNLHGVIFFATNGSLCVQTQFQRNNSGYRRL